MMRIPRFLSLVFLLLLPIFVFGQSEEIDFAERETIQPNEVFILQVGSGNVMDVNQSRTDGFILSGALQLGDLNSVNLSLTGDNLITGIFQKGSSNGIDLDVSGRAIRGTVMQNGRDNYIGRSLSGEDASFEFTQIGNGHSILQEGPPALNGLEIRQEGLVGMTVIITNN